MAPEAPTDMSVSGLISSDIAEPVTALTANTPANQARPITFSSTTPAKNSAMPLKAMWIKPPCKSGAEKSRHHCPSSSTRALSRAPSAASVSDAGGHAAHWANAKGVLAGEYGEQRREQAVG